MFEPPTVSIIIPTLGRPELVCETICSLRAQSYQPLQIIIVEQGEQSPAISAALKPWGGAGILLTDSGFGAARARNLGLAHARGDVLLFLDDDVIIDDPSFVACHARSYKNSEIGAVCGRTVELREKARRRYGGPPPSVLLPVCIVYGRGDSQERTSSNNVKGGNVSIRRDAVSRSGGFDPTFGSPSMYEETDLALRVIQCGYKILFEPDACLIHIGASRGGQREGTKATTSCRFLAYRDRVLLFRKHAPPWTMPIFLAVNLLAALYPLFRGRIQATADALTGLFVGVREYPHTIRPNPRGRLVADEPDKASGQEALRE